MKSVKASVKFDLRLKFQIFKTIMDRLKWKEKLPFFYRFLFQRYKIQKSNLFSGSDFALENRERFKLQLNVLALHAALRTTIGDEKALLVMASVLQASASEAFVETMQLIAKLGSVR